MIPILVSRDTTVFDGVNTAGQIGSLADAQDCVVTEEINGEYSLTMRYRYDGKEHLYLDVGAYILAEHDDSGDIQPFIIERKVCNLDGSIEIYAAHMSSWLGRITVYPINAGSLRAALMMINSHSMTSSSSVPAFSFSTDIESDVYYHSRRPRTIRNMLAGEEGSMLDVYGQGELVFDNHNVRYLSHRGSDRGLVLRHGKNLTKMVYTDDRQNVYNAIVPYYYDSYEGTLVMGATGNTYSDYIVDDGDTVRFALPVDVTDRFDSVPTAAQVKAAGQSWLTSNKPYNKEPTMSVSFEAAWQLGEEKATRTPVRLGDSVQVVDRRFYINGTYRVQKIVYDVLRGRFKSVEIGKMPPSLYKTIRKIAKSAKA